jgi:hypothetical protein
VTSLLVLTLVVVVPLLSFLVDLYLLDAARTRCRITVIAQPPPDDTPGHDPTPGHRHKGACFQEPTATRAHHRQPASPACTEVIHTVTNRRLDGAVL